MDHGPACVVCHNPLPVLPRCSCWLWLASVRQLNRAPQSLPCTALRYCGCLVGPDLAPLFAGRLLPPRRLSLAAHADGVELSGRSCRPWWPTQPALTGTRSNLIGAFIPTLRGLLCRLVGDARCSGRGRFCARTPRHAHHRLRLVSCPVHAHPVSLDVPHAR